MVHVLTYIILQLYRRRPADSNTRKPNISLNQMIANNDACWVLGFHVKSLIFIVLSDLSKNIYFYSATSANAWRANVLGVFRTTTGNDGSNLRLLRDTFASNLY